LAMRGAAPARCHGQTCRSRRGPRPGHSCIRVAQEPGRPCGSILDKIWRGAASPESSRPPGRRRTWRDRRTQAHGDGTANRRKTKGGRTVRRESERLIVPLKRGNSSREDPVEGRGRRAADPQSGNRLGTLSPVCRCPSGPRVAVSGASFAAASLRRYEPYAGNPHVRICGRGGGQPPLRPGAVATVAIAPGKLGKGGRASNSETFRRNPAGPNPVR
jgi:hypothetical protein